MNLLVTNVTLNGAWEVKPACRMDCAEWGEGLDDRIMANVDFFFDLLLRKSCKYI